MQYLIWRVRVSWASHSFQVINLLLQQDITATSKHGKFGFPFFIICCKQHYPESQCISSSDDPPALLANSDAVRIREA